MISQAKDCFAVSRYAKIREHFGTAKDYEGFIFCEGLISGLRGGERNRTTAGSRERAMRDKRAHSAVDREGLFTGETPSIYVFLTWEKAFTASQNTFLFLIFIEKQCEGETLNPSRVFSPSRAAKQVGLTPPDSRFSILNCLYIFFKKPDFTADFFLIRLYFWSCSRYARPCFFHAALRKSKACD